MLAAVSTFLLVMFMVSIALSFVSSPQDIPSYTFISKGSLLLTGTIVGWAAPLALSAGTHGCPTSTMPTTTFVTIMCACMVVGIAATLVEWLAGGLYQPQTKMGPMIAHIVVDGCIIVTSMVSPMTLMVGRDDVGSAGIAITLLISLVVLLWSAVDMTMGIIFLTTSLLAEGSRPIIPSAGPPAPGVLIKKGGADSSITDPPDVTMYMQDVGLGGGRFKKDDDMFVHDDVRRSLLRQRMV